MSEFKRDMMVRPAYDCIGVQPCKFGSERCKPGEGGSHGRHNAELVMGLSGQLADITLVIGTGWDLPSVPAREWVSRITDDPPPHLGRVELHTARPYYDDQTRNEPAPGASCEAWGGCYNTVGYTLADEPMRLLVSEGSDAVWAWLENYYATTVADMRRVASSNV